MVVYVVKTFWKLKKLHENSGSDLTKFSWQRIPTQNVTTALLPMALLLTWFNFNTSMGK